MIDLIQKKHTSINWLVMTVTIFVILAGFWKTSVSKAENNELTDAHKSSEAVGFEPFDYLNSAAIPEAELYKLIAPDGATSDNFGASIDIDGDTLVIGAPRARGGPNNFIQGAAYVFVRTDAGWIFQAKLKPSEASINEGFGNTLSISGNTVVVGAQLANVGANPTQGTAYIFVRNGSDWSLQQKVSADDGIPNAQFGVSVAIDSDKIIVGAFKDKTLGVEKGSAYIFTHNNGNWTQQAKLLDPQGEHADQFGSSVGIENDTAIVGSVLGYTGSIRTGVVFVYQRAGGSWTQQARLSPSVAESEYRFGISLAIDADTIIVGADRGHVVSAGRTGSAYIFVRSESGWTQQQELIAVDGAAGDLFGASVDISGETALVGAWRDSVGANNAAGSAYVFAGNGGSWSQQAKLLASDAASADFFGGSVALSNNKFVAGASGADLGSNSAQGAAYFFIKSTSAPDLQAANDTGVSSADNITSSRNLSFDVGGITNGANIELLRNGTVVNSSIATGNTVTLTDSNLPSDGIFQYVARQVINGEVSSLSEVTTVTVDNIAPTAAVEQNISQADPTAGNSVAYTVGFSEIVVGFESSDVSLIGSTADVSAATVLVSGTGPGYNVSVNNVISDGQTVRAAIPAGVFVDLAGNSGSASNSGDNTVTVDNVRPKVTINQAASQIDPTATLPVNFTVVFSEPVNGFDASDISLIGSSANTVGATVNITGSGSIYNLSVGNIVSNGQFVRPLVRANGTQDALGNGNLVSTGTDFTVTVDNVAPTVTINQAAGQTDPTSTQPVNFTVVFSEPATGFAASDVSLAGSTANTSVANIAVTGSSNVYTVSISNITSDGQIRASLAAGAATDAAGNSSSASTSSDNRISVTVTSTNRLFDFDGDGKTDISIFRPSVGEWWYLRSSDDGNYAAQFGNSSDKLTPADFTGDGKTDIALFRPTSGEWFVLRSEDGSFYSYPFGTNGDIPVTGDFDADGKADSGVFRPSTATWFIRKSSDGTAIIQQFGQVGDIPVVADYDGDGKVDIAIYRVSNGEWWINRSTAGLIAFQFGNSTDKSVQGDYTGDGKADVALFRPTTGEWFVLRSENQSYYSFPFGTNGDVPAPGDYDGDGKMDATVYRSSNTTWYSQRTTAGTLIQAFGITGDTPIPNAFVP
jgi:hypothetical protein